MSVWRATVSTIGLVVALAKLAGAAGPTFPGTDAKWRHYQSPNFELYSRGSDSESRMLLHNLELVRAVFLENFKLRLRRAVPLTVYLFSRDKFFDAYRPESSRRLEDIGAFYHADPDRGVLLMAPTPTFEVAQQLAFGSYTYHIFRLLDERPPLWFTTGMAGLFRNLDIAPKHIGFGKLDTAQISRLQHNRLLPTDALLFADHRSELYVSNKSHLTFHDQSWALLHYLYLGQHKIPRQQVDEFIQFILNESHEADAERMRTAATSLLGFDFIQLNARLDHYVHGGRYGVSKLPAPSVPERSSFSRRQVPADEMHLRLAELALRMSDSPAGRLALLDALGREGAEPRLWEAIGSSDYRGGDRDRAAERWATAVEKGSANPAVFHELGLIESQRWFRRFDLHFRLPDETATRLRLLLQQSIRAAPDQVAAYEMLAWVEATARSPDLANVNLVQSRYPTLKEKPRTLLALAMVRWRHDDHATATKLLDALDAMEAGEWVDYGSEQIRARIEGRPAERNRAPGTTRGKAPPVRVPGIKAPKSVQLPGRN